MLTMPLRQPRQPEHILIAFLVIFLIFFGLCGCSAPNPGPDNLEDECKPSRVVCYTELPQGNISWRSFFDRMPGTRWNNGNPIIRNSRYSPIYIIDGMKVFMFDFDFSPYDVYSVEAVTDPVRILRYLGIGSGGGIVIIKTKIR